jgi:hypothetical protein
MMTTKLLLPILNKEVVLFKGPVWGLSPTVSIRMITPEEYGLISDKIPVEYKSFFTNKCKCISIDGVKLEESENVAHYEGSKISFLLNYFKRSNPVVISFAVKIIQKRKTLVDGVIYLPVAGDVRLHHDLRYNLKTGIDSRSISEFYEVISKVLKKNAAILLSLERFSSALHRVQPLDKIIDISVCLESLIVGTNELRNRFALYNAWTAELDITKRYECFKLLENLYDARSAVVHGITSSEKDYKKKIDPIIEKWDNIIGIAEKALAYYILYIYQHDVDEWSKHQQCLALGIEKRIT